MIIAGIGLGIVLVAVTVSVLTGARDEESGMLSGLNTTGHEIGGSLGIAVLATIATSALGPGGRSRAASATPTSPPRVIAAAASLAALVILPSAKTFLPKLALTPHVAVH